jgi:transcriptional regulator with XRE-family HTH domain
VFLRYSSQQSNGTEWRMLVKSTGRIFIGNVIKERRMKKNMTQLQLAHRSNIDRSYLNELEKTYGRPSLLTLFKLAEGLDTCPGSLIMDIHSEYKLNGIIEEQAE